MELQTQSGAAFALAALASLAILTTGCITPANRLLAPLENALVYQPTNLSETKKLDVDLDYQDVFFESADGVELHGWYCAVENPRAVVLFAHGNAGNIADRAALIKRWTQGLQVSVFAFDYRGYGRSTGIPSEVGLLQDTRAARTCLAELAGMNESEIVLYGRSIGGAVMVDLAAHDGAKALVLESTFTSLQDVADWKFPFAGVGSSLKNSFNSLDKIGSYQGPVLIAHGRNDNVVPFSQGRELFEAANQPRSFVPIPKARHNWTPPYDYLLTLSRFIDSLN